MNSPELYKAWETLWHDLGCSLPPMSVYRQLLNSYNEPQRKYHNLKHLTDCLQFYRAIRPSMKAPGEVAAALWFHDAVYETRQADNELQSADWAFICAVESGASLYSGNRIHKLVMSTRHQNPPGTADQAILMDIDLSILGASATRFIRYEKQVRAEYFWVPDRLYREQRIKLLENFLGRQNIYQTRLFRKSREDRARRNLDISIKRLSDDSI